MIQARRPAAGSGLSIHQLPERTGLGAGDFREVQVQSALSQPLRAQIPLSDVGDLGAGEVLVRLASAESI